MKFKKSLLEKKNTYVVGVSGGSDSMALLDILYCRGYSIIVAHVNYHVRDDSNDDQRIVQSYCKTRHIPCYVHQVYDYEDENFEMQARNIRYDFYRKIMKATKASVVALGHHQDDNIETIIMQLNRGNISGYLGIKDDSYVKGMKVIRPLLKCNKQDLVNYCFNSGVNYNDDYTNFSVDYTRNYIRNIVLKNSNERQKEALLEYAQKHNDILERKNEIFRRYYKEYEKEGTLKYHKIPDYALESVIYYMLKEHVYPPLISKSLIKEIIKELASNKPNIKINLPVNFLFIKEYDNIYITKDKKNAGFCNVYQELIYDYNDNYTISNRGHLNAGVYLDDDEFPITIRTIQPGDKIKTKGGTKKVSRLFIDNKIPKFQRDNWPILVNCHDEILLVPLLAKNVDYLYVKPNVFVIEFNKL